jgi:hypothetical protein
MGTGETADIGGSTLTARLAVIVLGAAGSAVFPNNKFLTR